MTRLIVFGGAPTVAELLETWEPAAPFEFEVVQSSETPHHTHNEQDDIEESYACGQPEAVQPSKQLKPISALRFPGMRETQHVLPRPSLTAATQLSVDSFGGNSRSSAGSLLEDSYAPGGASQNYSAALKLPDYRFVVDKIMPLADCLAAWRRWFDRPHPKNALETDVLGFVFDIEPLRSLDIKSRGRHPARLLKFELGDESSTLKAVGKLKISAWDDVAESLSKEIRKGDIVWISRKFPSTFGSRGHCG